MAAENDQSVEALRRQLAEARQREAIASEVLRVIAGTSDVLKTAGRASVDLQSVLDALTEAAVRLCGADKGLIRRRDGDRYIAVSTYAFSDEFRKWAAGTVLDSGRDNIVARAASARRTVHIADVLAEPGWQSGEWQRLADFRSAIAAPLLSGEDILGVLVVHRTEPIAFTELQIGLVETFADQAVIAIENTRLFEEVQSRTGELARTVADLEIASQHKSQFVANMSHELRTPLAAMLGYAELLQEGIYGELPEKSLPILTRIRSNGKHLLGLINTVLDISKIEAGQFKLNLDEYSLGSIVDTVMSATESLATAKQLAFKSEVAEGLPYGLGDEQRLTQVLLNLVGNAIKFTDNGEVRIAAGAANGRFAVSVSDTGPGIPAEECERIFEKFRQVDSSNTRAKSGTGLGLAIAKEIVEMHGGRVWVESTIGRGSTFHLTFPVRAAAVVGAV